LSDDDAIAKFSTAINKSTNQDQHSIDQNKHPINKNEPANTALPGVMRYI
jgi:hypothetical protein